jgi:putative modified peptide
MTDSMSFRDPTDFVEDTSRAIFEAPIFETPILETPILETPILETPILETPILETPIGGSLTKAQGLALLARLVRDEGFRGKFEQRPSSALLELGIPAEQIATLRPACLAQRRLAPAAELEVARRKLELDLETQTLIFVVPNAKI